MARARSLLLGLRSHMIGSRHKLSAAPSCCLVSHVRNASHLGSKSRGDNCTDRRKFFSQASPAPRSHKLLIQAAAR